MAGKVYTTIMSLEDFIITQVPDIHDKEGSLINAFITNGCNCGHFDSSVSFYPLKLIKSPEFLYDPLKIKKYPTIVVVPPGENAKEYLHKNNLFNDEESEQYFEIINDGFISKVIMKKVGSSFYDTPPHVEVRFRRELNSMESIIKVARVQDNKC